MTKKHPAKYNAPALDKGLDIIEFLSITGIPKSQIEIADGIKKTPSEIYRMLVCLEERGYLLREGGSGKYSLSLKMYGLSHRHSPFDELKRVAQYPMQQLSQITRQSCHLSILHDGQLMVISQIRSPGAVSLSIAEGTLFPLSMTTSGKVLLSMLAPKERSEILSRDNPFSQWPKGRQQKMFKAIDQARTDGHCYSASHLTNGVTDVAVPIGIPNSELVSALAVSILTSNLEEEIDISEILTAMHRAQGEIHRLVGVSK